MVGAALRRILLLLVGSLLVISAASFVLGLALGASPARSISLGLTITGSFLLISGFFIGNRGPARLKDDEEDHVRGGLLSFDRRMRWATPGESNETINLSAVFVAVGFVLILIGIAADPRYRLV